MLSYDNETMPDSLAGFAASAALAVSDIPFDGPISEVRVARIGGEFVINPTKSQLADADIDLMVGASADSIAMVEGEMKEVSEAEMVEAIKAAHEAIKDLRLWWKNLRPSALNAMKPTMKSCVGK